MKNPYTGSALYLRLFILTLVILISGFFSTVLVRNIVIQGYLYESRQKVEMYSEFIESRLIAYDRVDSFIENLLNQEIRMLATLLLNEKANFSDAYFAQKLVEYNVSTIAWVNDSGQTIAASDPIFYQYQIDQNHVLWDFFISEETILIEPIRESFIYVGRPFKIANFKDEFGYMLQIAIEVEDYNAIVDDLTIQAIIQDIYSNSNILYAKMISPSYQIIAHSENSFIGQQELEEHLKEAIDLQTTITHSHSHTIEEVDAYSIAIPIFVNDTFNGLLDIGFDPDYVLPVVNTVNTIVLISMTVLTIIIYIVSILGGKARSMMYEAAFVDSQTGLYTKQALDYMISKSSSNQSFREMSFVLMNVENYLDLVAIHGIERLNKVIQTFGERLVASYNKQFIFKVSSNEFLVLCQSKDKTTILNKLKESRTLLTSDIVIQDLIFNIEYTIAILDDFQEMSYSEIDRNLTRVMREAKITNKGGYLFYDQDLMQRIDRKQTIENELKKALLLDTPSTLYPVFQPQVNPQTNEIIGFEALSRLQLDAYGFIPPPEFIQIAEQGGLIQELGRVILKQSAFLYHQMVQAGMKPLPISINVSTLELMQKDFSKRFLDSIKKESVPAEFIRIEITETTLATNFEVLESQLMVLRNAGVKISVDDFGTGYSSLSYLQVAPVDFIKIDKTFIDELRNDDGRYQLSEAVISIAHQLHTKVIAEGVETIKQVNRLKSMDCDYIQGYYYSKPLKMESCLDYMKSMNLCKEHLD